MNLINAETGVEVSQKMTSETVRRAVEHLNQLEPGQFLTFVQLSARIGSGISTLVPHAPHPPLCEMRMKRGIEYIYFSEETAAALREEGQL